MQFFQSHGMMENSLIWEYRDQQQYISLMFSAAVFLLLLFFVAPSSSAETDSPAYREYLARAEEYAKQNRQREAGEALRAAVELDGAKHPFLHMRLAKFYAGQGLVTDAVAEAEKAVSRAPSARWYRYDLATFYLAAKQYNKAEAQLCTLLKIDPGFASGYCSLAELYSSTGREKVAGFAAKRARLLGCRGDHPAAMPADSSAPPEEDLDRAAAGSTLFRFIKVSSAGRAEAVLQEIGKGRLFEDFERGMMEATARDMEFGVMLPSELPNTVAAPLATMRPYAPPRIVKTGQDFRIMQRILPFDPGAWRAIAEDSSSSAREPEGPAAGSRDKGGPPDAIAAMYTLEEWKKAWEAADLERYLATYSKSFSPAEGISYAAWQEKRRKSLIRPRAIRIKLSDTVIETLGPNKVELTFRQDYQSDSHRDSAIKSMIMVRETEGWKIISESIVRELPR